MTRQVYAEVPPRVTYDLTVLGRTLIEPIQTLTKWAEANGDALLAAQEGHVAAPRGASSASS